MTDQITLSWGISLETRSTDTTGRKVSGIVVPWDEPTELNRSTIEVFRQGALTKTVQERGDKIPLHFTHDPLAIIGKAIEWRDDKRGQWAEFEVSKTTRGDDALELIRDGVMHSFSIGFKPIADRTSKSRTKDGRNVYERKEVRLGHVALVPNPAYAGATVDALRAELEELTEGTPKLDAARRKLLLLSN